MTVKPFEYNPYSMQMPTYSPFSKNFGFGSSNFSTPPMLQMPSIWNNSFGFGSFGSDWGYGSPSMLGWGKNNFEGEHFCSYDKFMQGCGIGVEKQTAKAESNEKNDDEVAVTESKQQSGHQQELPVLEAPFFKKPCGCT